MALCVSEESQRQAIEVVGSRSIRVLFAPPHKPSVVIWVTYKKKKNPLKCFHKFMHTSLLSYFKTFHHPEKKPTYIHRPLIVFSTLKPWQPWSIVHLCGLAHSEHFVSMKLYMHGLLWLGFAHLIHFEVVQVVAYDYSKEPHSSLQLNNISVYTYPTSCLSVYQWMEI